MNTGSINDKNISVVSPESPNIPEEVNSSKIKAILRRVFPGLLSAVEESPVKSIPKRLGNRVSESLSKWLTSIAETVMKIYIKKVTPPYKKDDIENHLDSFHVKLVKIYKKHSDDDNAFKKEILNLLDEAYKIEQSIQHYELNGETLAFESPVPELNVALSIVNEKLEGSTHNVAKELPGQLGQYLSKIGGFFGKIPSKVITTFIKTKQATITQGIENLSSFLTNLFSRKDYESQLTQFETQVCNKVSNTIKDVSDIYENRNLENAAQSVQTTTVLNELQSEKKLHEAILVLTVEEEELWESRDQYLKSGETFQMAVSRIEKDNPPDKTEKIETLNKLSKIENKIWDHELKYLKKIAEKLFDKILYPNDSFYKSFGPGKKKANFIKEQIVYGLACALYAGIEEASDPSHYFRMLTSESKAESEESVQETPNNVRVTGLEEASTGVKNLAYEVSRVGFPKTTAWTGSAFQFATSAVNMADQAVNTLWNTVWGTSAEPRKPIDPFVDVISHQIYQINQQLMLPAADGTIKILDTVHQQLEGLAKAEPPGGEVGAKHKERVALKEKTIEKVQNTLWFSPIARGGEQIVNRFANRRLNRLLMYQSLSVIEEKLEAF